MAVQAADVKKLREITGAGMLECKKALTETDGDIKKAEKVLKERGVAAATKRSGRATNEGRIFSHTKGDAGGLLELACETDFVARNSDFVSFGENLIAKVVEDGRTEVDSELEQKVKELISILKENIKIRRFDTINSSENEMLIDYIHGEGRIGVIVKFHAEDASKLQEERVKNLAFDCALHVAAFNPIYLSKDTVEADYLKEQEEIFYKQVQQLGKPEKVLEGIVKGKLNKHLSEICLLNQGFVKEEKKSVQQILQEVSKEIGTTLSITGYLYYRVGEELKE